MTKIDNIINTGNHETVNAQTAYLFLCYGGTFNILAVKRKRKSYQSVIDFPRIDTASGTLHQTGSSVSFEMWYGSHVYWSEVKINVRHTAFRNYQ